MSRAWAKYSYWAAPWNTEKAASFAELWMKQVFHDYIVLIKSRLSIYKIECSASRPWDILLKKRIERFTGPDDSFLRVQFTAKDLKRMCSVKYKAQHCRRAHTVYNHFCFLQYSVCLRKKSTRTSQKPSTVYFIDHLWFSPKAVLETVFISLHFFPPRLYHP